ncbi:hypothetical protein [Borrelia sp. P9F1]|nr:hypothetical protein [Borrelia sp. P9F1]WKC58510.1 hypothetical protein QYZ68_04845 [Borrelia sp. P9F1]
MKYEMVKEISAIVSQKTAEDVSKDYRKSCGQFKTLSKDDIELFKV